MGRGSEEAQQSCHHHQLSEKGAEIKKKLEFSSMGQQVRLILWRLHQEDRLAIDGVQAVWTTFKCAVLEFATATQLSKGLASCLRGKGCRLK